MDQGSVKGSFLGRQWHAEQGNRLAQQSQTPGSSHYLSYPECHFGGYGKVLSRARPHAGSMVGTSADTVCLSSQVVEFGARLSKQQPPTSCLCKQFYWHTAMLLYFCVAGGCFGLQLAELRPCNRGRRAHRAWGAYI